MPESSISAVPHRLAIRAVLGALGLVQLVDGLYALFAPQLVLFATSRSAAAGSRRCPPTTSTWSATSAASSSPPGSCWWPRPGVLERRLVIVACASYLLFALPHAIYHYLNLGPYDTGDAIANAVTLAATVLLPIWVLFELRRRPARPAPGRRRAAPRGNARIAGVPESTRNPLVRLAYRVSRAPLRRGDRPDAALRPPSRGDGRLLGARARLGALAARRQAAQAPGRDPRGDDLAAASGASTSAPRSAPRPGSARRTCASCPPTRERPLQRRWRSWCSTTRPGCRGARSTSRTALRAAPRAPRRGPAGRADEHHRARELPLALQLGVRDRGPGVLRGLVLRSARGPPNGDRGGRLSVGAESAQAPETLI